MDMAPWACKDPHNMIENNQQFMVHMVMHNMTMEIEDSRKWGDKITWAAVTELTRGKGNKIAGEGGFMKEMSQKIRNDRRVQSTVLGHLVEQELCDKTSGPTKDTRLFMGRMMQGESWEGAVGKKCDVRRAVNRGGNIWLMGKPRLAMSVTYC